MKIASMMDTDFVTAQPFESSELIAERMDEQKADHAVVFEKDDPIGVICQSTIERIRTHRFTLFEGLDATDVMKPLRMLAHVDDDVRRTAAHMGVQNLSCAPVVDDEGHVVGIIRSTQMLARQDEWQFHPEMTVADIMTRDPDTARPDDPAETAVSHLVEGQVRHLPVVDEDNVLVGIISDRDVRTLFGDPVRVLREERWDAADPVLVREIMTASPVVVRADQGVGTAVRVLREERLSALPVVDAQDRLVGIVSYIDILDAFDTGSPS